MEARWPLEQMTQAVPVARNRVNLAGQVGHEQRAAAGDRAPCPFERLSHIEHEKIVSPGHRIAEVCDASRWVPAWAEANGDDLLESGEADGVFVLYVRKAADE